MLDFSFLQRLLENLVGGDMLTLGERFQSLTYLSLDRFEFCGGLFAARGAGFCLRWWLGGLRYRYLLPWCLA
jgi:hypothetical protein